MLSLVQVLIVDIELFLFLFLGEFLRFRHVVIRTDELALLWVHLL